VETDMRRYAVAVLLGIVGCASFEDSVVFHPRIETSLPPAPPGVVSSDFDLPLANNVKVHARLYAQQGATGTILFCPGNAGNMESRADTIKDLRVLLNMQVLIFDYPGYGASSGTPSEAGCYASADAAYEWLRTQAAAKKLALGTIVIYGESLGGAVAVDLATKKPHDFLVLNRTFTSVPDVADYQMPLLPNSMLMHNRFETLSKIAKCPSPIFLANADKDGMVPLQQGNQLKLACTAPSVLYTMRGLGHNDSPPTEFYLRLRSFMAEPANRGGATKNAWPTSGAAVSAPAPPGVAALSPLAVPSPAR
jgi:uncharacterized protein